MTRLLENPSAQTEKGLNHPFWGLSTLLVTQLILGCESYKDTKAVENEIQKPPALSAPFWDAGDGGNRTKEHDQERQGSSEVNDSGPTSSGPDSTSLTLPRDAEESDTRDAADAPLHPGAGTSDTGDAADASSEVVSAVHPEDSGTPDDLSPRLTLKGVQRVELQLDVASQVAVDFVQNDCTEEVRLSLFDAPSWLAIDQTTPHELTLRAGSGAELGLAQFGLQAACGPLVSQIVVPLLVRGLAGTLDETFSSDGMAWVGETSFAAKSVVELPDGSIVLGGATSNAPWVITRVTSTGEFDPGFVAPSPLADATLDAIATSDDGSLFVAGKYGEWGAVLARYSKEGELDAKFGGTGVVEVYNSSRVALVVASSTGHIMFATNRLRRLSRDGAQDPTYVHPEFDPAIDVGALAETDNGEMLVAGVYEDSNLPSGYRWGVRVLRYTEDGLPDESFGSLAAVTVPLVSMYGARITDARIVSDGSIWLTGYADDLNQKHQLLLHLGAKGEPDVTLGPNGLKLVTSWGNQYAEALIEHPSGGVVVAGHTNNEDQSNSSRGLVAKFSVEGEIDPTFAATSLSPGVFSLASQDDPTWLYAMAPTGLGRAWVAGNQKGRGALLMRLWL